MKRLILSLSVLSASVILGFSASEAATVGTDLTVSASVTSDCMVQTTPLNFGEYSGTTVVSVGGSGIDVVCTVDTPYNITLSGGTFYDGLNRNIHNGGVNRIGYVLYQDFSMTTQWGDADFVGSYPLGSSKADIGTGYVQTHTVYATLLGGALVSAGTYNDTVNVTVNY